MFEVLDSILGIVIFVTSIYLIISGVSKKVKYSSAEFIKKRNLMFGIVLLFATLYVTNWTDAKDGFIRGWNEG